MTLIITGVAGLAIGIILGSAIERVTSFPKLKRELSGLADKIDGKTSN